MLETLFAYIEANTWAQWALAILLVVPPVLISWVNGERGFAPIGTILGWWTLLLGVALLLV